MKAHLHLETFDGKATFSTWLMRIAINSALMMRKERHHPETPLEDWGNLIAHLLSTPADF
jgi:RNA polymerase sigma-70 factor (ECF subfamily)